LVFLCALGDTSFVFFAVKNPNRKGRKALHKGHKAFNTEQSHQFFGDCFAEPHKEGMKSEYQL
jgi:hypothetical protein